MAQADTALRDLITYPKAFLENNGLVIYSGDRVSAVTPFRLVLLEDQWQSVIGGSARSIPAWGLALDGVKLGKARPGEAQSAPISAHYVSMREYKNGGYEAADVTHYTLPSAGGPDVMFTSKLNGCSFGIGSSGGGTRLVTHLRPPSGNGPANEKLATLSGGVDAGFAANGGSLAVKVTSDSLQNATILSKRSGTDWKFFVQRFKVVGTFAKPIVEMVLTL
jgi:hypothetical protein